MAYTNQIPNQANTFRINQGVEKEMYEIINEISNSGNRLILEGCKPFENVSKEFNGRLGSVKKDEFLNYLQSIFNSLKNLDVTKIKDCTNETLKLNSFVNLNFNQINLRKALTKDNFEQFLYTLFFNDCKMENFPSGFSSMAFPIDSLDVNSTDIKNKIIFGLKSGKPILFSGLCISENKEKDCKKSHSFVISGYKKVKDGNLIKDVFKVHNSYGTEWQKIKNNGWCDADIICQNSSLVQKDDGNYRIGSACVIWLD